MIHEHGMLRFNVNFIDNRCWGWFTYSSICIRQIEHIFFVMLFCYKMPEARICGVWDRKKTLQFLTGCRVHFLISILSWITSRWTNFSFCISLFDNRNMDGNIRMGLQIDWLICNYFEYPICWQPCTKTPPKRTYQPSRCWRSLEKNAYFLSAYKNESFILNLKDVRWYIHQSWWWWWRNAMNNIRFDRSTLKQMNSCIIKLYV